MELLTTNLILLIAGMVAGLLYSEVIRDRAYAAGKEESQKLVAQLAESNKLTTEYHEFATAVRDALERMLHDPEASAEFHAAIEEAIRRDRAAKKREIN